MRNFGFSFSNYIEGKKCTFEMKKWLICRFNSIYFTSRSSVKKILRTEKISVSWVGTIPVSSKKVWGKKYFIQSFFYHSRGFVTTSSDRYKLFILADFFFFWSLPLILFWRHHLRLVYKNYICVGNYYLNHFFDELGIVC